MKTFKTPIYDNIEFAFTTSTYSTTGNTYVGIHSKENDCIEPYCNLTVKSDGQPGHAARQRSCFHRREQCGQKVAPIPRRTGFYLSHRRDDAIRICRLSPLSAQPR